MQYVPDRMSCATVGSVNADRRDDLQGPDFRIWYGGRHIGRDGVATWSHPFKLFNKLRVKHKVKAVIIRSRVYPWVGSVWRPGMSFLL